MSLCEPETLNMLVNEARKPFNKKDTFLTQLEKYVKENGTEALENLIATKIGSHPDNENNEINTVTEVEQPKLAKPKVESKDISTVEATDKKEGSSIKPISLIEPKLSSAKTNTFAPPYPIAIPIQAKECIGLPNTIPTQAKEQPNFHRPLIRRPFVQRGRWRERPNLHLTDSNRVRTSESDLASHLQGRRHRAAHAKLQAKNQTPKMEVLRCSDGKKCAVPSTDAEKLIPGNHSGAKNTTPKVNKPLKKKDLNKWCCVICNAKCHNQLNFVSHLNGSKHLARIKGANKI